MKRYLVIHHLHTPEHLQDGRPRDLNGVYFVHSEQDGSVVADVEMPIDSEGQPVYTLEQTVTVVAGAMYANTPVIRLRQMEALDLLSTPQWSVYAGQYKDEADLIADCAALGFAPVGATLVDKIADAQMKLKMALSA